MATWHWLQTMSMVIGLASVFLAAPVSLIFAWTGWIRTDRHGKDGWRTKALHGALVLVSLAATAYFVALGLQWWTQMQQSPTQKVLLDWVCIIGALFCLFGLLVATLGKGRARVPTACTAFFVLFLFLQSTPLAYLP